MHTWIDRLRLQVPRWLARESASAWIMVGTLTGAGLAAPALASGQSPPSQTPAIQTPGQIVPPSQASPAFGWSCRAATVGAGQSGCAGRFGHGRHYGHWRHHQYGGDGWAQGRDYGSIRAIPAGGPTSSTVDAATN